MANRHLSRSIVLQSLFEWDFFQLKPAQIKSIVERNADEFAPGMKDISFAEHLADTVVKKKSDLDTIIEKAAPDWPIDKINGVDRNVLRVGLCELLFSDREEVPPKVAINEAIELAKTFGGETSGKFVNGVLGAVYKEMGEPGKDQQSSKGTKGKKNSLDDQNIPLEQLGGAVVYAKDNDKVYVALVHDVFGHWTLSKGKLEKDEDVKDGTEREIKEEIGLNIKIKDDLGVNEYIAYHPEKGKLRKRVHYFLAEAQFEPLKLESSGGLDDCRWFTVADIVDLNFYDDVLPIITKAMTILAENHNKG
ncbi:MAG: transcription antitermination factor NusB [Minisyncoccia bacterium]